VNRSVGVRVGKRVDLVGKAMTEGVRYTGELCLRLQVLMRGRRDRRQAES
jgi:hypothetical protein